MTLAQQTDYTLAFHATGSDKSRLSIVLMPIAKDGQEPALAYPVKLEGTVEEIEAGFEEAISKYATARAQLTEQLDATLTILKQAQKASAEKAADKLKGGPSKAPAKAPAKPSATATPAVEEADDLVSDDDGDDDDADGNAGAPAPAAPAADAPASIPMTSNLFGG